MSGTKEKYSEGDKLRILKKAWPRIKAGQPIKLVAIWQKVPYGTLNQWISRLRAEGGESLKDKSPTCEISTKELNLILSFLEERDLNPTPKQFKIACRRLKTTRKPTTLYVYYRKRSKVWQEHGRIEKDSAGAAVVILDRNQ